ncbi:MAG: HAD family hydrolase [Anaeroplasmataceae bacterium]
MKKGIIFDLDGTLLNTLDDILDSVNHSLEKFDLPAITKNECRSFIGSGPRVLIEKSLKGSIDKFDDVYDEYMLYYDTHNNIKTKPYDGIIELLKTLKQKGFKIGIVSNKQDSATKEMALKYFNDLIDVSIGSNDLVRKKPAFDMVNIALDKLGIKESEAYYVGDSEVDIKTALGKIDLIMVSWGFRDKETLLSNNPPVIVDDTNMLLEKINGH